MSLKYWLKTKLYQFTPGGWGYYRYLRSLKKEDYEHERDKHEVRRKHYGEEGWKDEKSEGLTYRSYDSYEEYVTHQVQKFDEILKMGVGYTNDVVGLYRKRFFRRFRHLPGLVSKQAKILCAGARQGTEVEVLQDLGFQNAYGIDLNPGPKNKWVVEGDFMNIEAKDASIDVFYTNAVDHAFELEKFFAEHARVLKDDGYAIYDIGVDAKGGIFEAVSWDSDSVIFQMMLKHFRRVVKVETDDDWQWIMLTDPIRS
ncbi:MAG: class I SAM-dependent methyltransferase [Opitutales bacterium]|nr:class I SAM-dependent methyltransferase [Opitutales bacterium]